MDLTDSEVHEVKEVFSCGFLPLRSNEERVLGTLQVRIMPLTTIPSCRLYPNVS